MAISMLKDGKITPFEEERGDASPRTEQEGEEQLQDAAPANILEEAEGFSGKEKAANRPGTSGTDGCSGAPEPQPREESAKCRRDWVEEAWKLFIKDAGDIDPTDPVKAIEAYFQKNATDELKARCKAEGKDAKGCWKFIEAVASKALHGSSGHIDPGVVYAIAMHWFEDVPKDWNKATKADTAKPKKPTTRKERLEERVSHGSRRAKAELRELKKKERAKAKPKAKKPKNRQGFFFEMLEAPATAPEAAASGTKQESEVKE